MLAKLRRDLIDNGLLETAQPTWTRVGLSPLYSMINLDGEQECRPLHPTHPTPRHGLSAAAGGQSARRFPQPARSQPVASGESRDKSPAGNMSNCRFGRIGTWKEWFGGTAGTGAGGMALGRGVGSW